MAKLNENSFRNWNNGDTMNESDYEQERSLIITAVNANDDEVKANKTAQDGIAARVTTAEGDIDDLETRATSAENRLDSAESKNTTQDSRLTAVESKNTTQDSRLDAAEGRLNANDGKNSTQDVRLNNIETKNTEQDGRLSSAETRITNAEGRLSSAESKNGEQDSRLSGVENRTTSTESRLNTAEGRISTVETNKTDRTGDHNGTFHGLLPGQIFGPSSTQDQRYTWTATEGQTTFVLSAEAVRFPVRKESIEVVVGGAPQTDFTVPNDSQIVLSEGVPLDVKVTASWAGLFVAPSAGTDITTLDNYQTEVADKIGILSDSVDEHAETLGSLLEKLNDLTGDIDAGLFTEGETDTVIDGGAF